MNGMYNDNSASINIDIDIRIRIGWSILALRGENFDDRRVPRR